MLVRDVLFPRLFYVRAAARAREREREFTRKAIEERMLKFPSRSRRSEKRLAFFRRENLCAGRETARETAYLARSLIENVEFAAKDRSILTQVSDQT